jgi:hypothetical protein
MAKQWTELEPLIIPKGKRVSNKSSLHPKTGTIATLTVYAPEAPSELDAYIYLSADGEEFKAFYHKDRAVKIAPNIACDIPLPACQSMRLETWIDAPEDMTYQVLALLEID